MSTYLAAWAILPDTYGQKTDDQNASNVFYILQDISIFMAYLFQVTVWARREPTDQNHTTFALEVALNSLAFFADYFNTSKPIPPKIGK